MNSVSISKCWTKCPFYITWEPSKSWFIFIIYQFKPSHDASHQSSSLHGESWFTHLPINIGLTRNYPPSSASLPITLIFNKIHAPTMPYSCCKNYNLWPISPEDVAKWHLRGLRLYLSWQYYADTVIHRDKS